METRWEVRASSVLPEVLVFASPLRVSSEMRSLLISANIANNAVTILVRTFRLNAARMVSLIAMNAAAACARPSMTATIHPSERPGL